MIVLLQRVYSVIYEIFANGELYSGPLAGDILNGGGGYLSNNNQGWYFIALEIAKIRSTISL